MTDGSVPAGRPEHPDAGLELVPPCPGEARLVSWVSGGPTTPRSRTATGHTGVMPGTRGTEEDAVTSKPTVEELGVDLDAQDWRRSGDRDGAIEIAFVPAADDRTEYVLMRVAGDATGRVLVYDRHEWECFLDGVRNGEFDEGA
jgi:hypothetical protein